MSRIFSTLFRYFRQPPPGVRKPVPARPIRNNAFLQMELLEKRELFTTASWLPRAPLPLGAAAGLNQDPWLTPLGYLLGPQYGVNNANVSATLATTAAFSLNDGGTYTFTLHLAGSNANNCITFDESGTSTFALYEGGTLSNGTYSFNSYSLAQNAVVSWHYVQTTLSGSVIQNTSGTDTLSVTDTAPALGDNFHWYGFNWYNLAGATSGAHSLSLGSYSWNSLTLDEGGSNSLTFNEAGTATLAENGSGLNAGGGVNQPPGGLPGAVLARSPGGDTASSNTTGFLYNRTESYTYTNAATGTYTLHEEGTSSGGNCLSLSSVLYNDRGTDTYTLNQAGNETVTGTGTTTNTTLLNGGLESGTAGASQAVNFSNAATDSYAETGSGTHTTREAGTYGGGSFAFASVSNQVAGTAADTFTVTGVQSYNGTTTATRNLSGNPTNLDNYGYLSATSGDTLSATGGDSYNFAGRDTYTYRSGATGTYSLNQTGSFLGGSFGLGSVALAQGGTATSAMTDTATQSWTGVGSSSNSDTGAGNGTTSADGTTDSGLGTSSDLSASSYSFSGTGTVTNQASQSWAFAFAAAGSYAAATWALGSATFQANGTGISSSQGSTTQTYGGSASATAGDSGAGVGTTTGYGGDTGSGLGSYNNRSGSSSSYGGSSSASYLSSGADTFSAALAGAYGNGTWALGSAVFQDSSTGLSNSTQVSSQSYSGTGSSSSIGTQAAADTTSIGSATFGGAGTFSYASTSSFSAGGSSTTTSTLSATTTASAYQAGAYAAGCYSFGSAVFQSSSLSTSGYQVAAVNSTSGQDTSSNSFTNTGAGTDTVGNDVFTSSGGASSGRSDSAAQSSLATSSYAGGATDSASDYRAGTFAAGSYAFSSVALADAGTTYGIATAAGMQTSSASGVASSSASGPAGATVVAGSLTLAGTGSSTVGNTATYSFLSTLSYTSLTGGNGTFSSYAAGSFSAGSYSLSSVLFQSGGASTWSYLSSGTDSASGGATAVNCFTSGGTLSDLYGGQSLAANGTSAAGLTTSYNYTRNGTSGATLTGAGSTSRYEAGAYAHASYALSSVVYQDQQSSTATYTASALETDTGTASSSSSVTNGGSALGTYGPATDSAADSATAARSDNSAVTTALSFTSAQFSTDSSTLYRAGAYGNGSYAFSSVAWSANGSASWLSTTAATQTSSGTGSSSGSAAGPAAATVALAGLTLGDRGTGTVSSTATYSFLAVVGYSASAAGSAVYSTFQGGSFAAESYGLSSVLFQSSGTLTSRYTSTQSSTSSGGGTSSSTTGGGATESDLFGGLSLSDTSAASVTALSSYTTGHTDLATYTQAGTTTFSRSEAGTYAPGGYSLSSVLYQTQANSAATYLDSAGQSDSGTGSSTSALTNTGGALLTHGPVTDSGSGTYTVNATDSYATSDTIATFETQTATQSATSYQAGVFANGSYALTSLVFTDSGTSGWTSTTYSQQTVSGTGTSVSVSTGPATTSFTLGPQAAGGTGNSTVTDSASYSFVSFFSATASVSSAGSSSRYQAGCFANGSYALSSVLFQAGGAGSSTYTGLGSSTSAGGDVAVSSFSGTGSETVTLGAALVTASGSATASGTQTSTYSGATSVTYTQAGSNGFSQYQAGFFAQGSYALGSVVYQAQAAGNASYVETDTQVSSATAVTSATLNAGDGGQMLLGYNGGAAAQSYTSTRNDTSAASSTATVSYGRYDASSASDSRAGSFALGSYSLGSVLYQSQALSTLTVQSQGTAAASSAGTLVSNGSGVAAQSTAFSYNSDALGGQSSYASTQTYNASSLATNTANSTSTDSLSVYQAGCFSNGSDALASVLLQGQSAAQASATQLTQLTALVAGTLSTSAVQTSAALVTYSNVNGNGSGVLNTTQTLTYADAGSSNATYTTLDNRTATSYQAGCFANGSSSFASVLFGQTAASNATWLLSSLETYGSHGSSAATYTSGNAGADSYGYAGYNGSLSLTSTALATFVASGTVSSLASSTSSANGTTSQAGCFSAGSYALTSVLFQSSGLDSSGYAASGTSLYSSTATVSAAGTSSAADSTTVGAFASFAQSSFVSFTVTEADWASLTSTFSARQTATQSFSSSQAGAWAAGSYTLGSVLWQSSAADSWNAAGSSTGSLTRSGTRAERSSAASGSGAVSNSNTFGTGGSNSYQGSDSYGAGDTQSGAWSSSGNDGAAVYAAGCYAAGSYAYASYTAAGSGAAASSATQTDVLGTSDLVTGSGVGAAAASASNPLSPNSYTGNDGSNFSVSGVVSRGGVQTSTQAQSATSSYAYSQGGALANGSYALGSVSQARQESQSWGWSSQAVQSWGANTSETWTALGGATAGTYSGGYAGSLTRTQSYTMTQNSGAGASGVSNLSMASAGSYAAGSYALSSVVVNQSGWWAQQSSANGTSLSQGTGVVSDSSNGISESGLSGTYGYASWGTYTWGGGGAAGGSWAEQRLGSYAAGSYAFGSISVQAVSSSTQAVGYGGTDSLTAGLSATDAYGGGGASSSLLTLSLSASLSGGVWAVSSFVQSASATGNTTFTESGAASVSLAPPGGGGGLGGGMAPPQPSIAWSYSGQGATTVSLYAAGSWANGSYSYQSLALEEDSGSSNAYQESGSNVGSFTSYNRSDASSDPDVLGVSGSGQLALATITQGNAAAHTFTGTQVGGVTIASYGQAATTNAGSSSSDLSPGAPPTADRATAQQAGGRIINQLDPTSLEGGAQVVNNVSDVGAPRAQQIQNNMAPGEAGGDGQVGRIINNVGESGPPGGLLWFGQIINNPVDVSAPPGVQRIENNVVPGGDGADGDNPMTVELKSAGPRRVPQEQLKLQGYFTLMGGASPGLAKLGALPVAQPGVDVVKVVTEVQEKAKEAPPPAADPQPEEDWRDRLKGAWRATVVAGGILVGGPIAQARQGIRDLRKSLDKPGDPSADAQSAAIKAGVLGQLADNPTVNADGTLTARRADLLGSAVEALSDLSDRDKRGKKVAGAVLSAADAPLALAEQGVVTGGQVGLGETEAAKKSGGAYAAGVLEGSTPFSVGAALERAGNNVKAFFYEKKTGRIISDEEIAAAESGRSQDKELSGLLTGGDPRQLTFGRVKEGLHQAGEELDPASRERGEVSAPLVEAAVTFVITDGVPLLVEGIGEKLPALGKFFRGLYKDELGVGGLPQDVKAARAATGAESATTAKYPNAAAVTETTGLSRNETTYAMRVLREKGSDDFIEYAKSKGVPEAKALEAVEKAKVEPLEPITEKTYQRPGGTDWRKGEREAAWKAAVDASPDGVVRDPLTGKPMKFDDPWEMGHKPGYEFRKHQQSAAERGLTRDQFLDEYHNSDHFRPELPDSNHSHYGEDRSSTYFGP